MASVRNPRKFAVVSHVLPPSPSGQAVVLSRLLRDLDPQEYCLVSVKDYAPRPEQGKLEAVTQRLQANYHALPNEMEWRLSPWIRAMGRNARSALTFMRKTRARLLSAKSISESESLEAPPIQPGTFLGYWQNECKTWLLEAEDRLNVRRQVSQRARHIFAVLAKESCNAVIGCSGDLIDLPAAFQAARRAGVPFFAYMFDDYATHFAPRFQRQFAHAIMPSLVRDAAGVIVPNEFLARTYRQHYGIEPWLIRNPIEIPAPCAAERCSVGPPIRIVYTGAVYEAHYDSFQRLIDILPSFGALHVELHIYTPMCKKNLARNRIAAPAILHDAVPAAEATRLQAAADILFLPLAFDSPIPELIASSAPGKMGELLASGRPILVHAPKDSFVSWYFRTHECGLVVDEKDPAALREAVRRMVQNPSYCQGLVRRARTRAECDFGLALAQARFRELLNGQAQG